MPEPWLSGPCRGVPALLQPGAHTMLLAIEQVDVATTPLTENELWHRPGGIASVGFHLAHLAGSTDRLITYARGEDLTEQQRKDLARERTIDEVRESKANLLQTWRNVARSMMHQLESTSEGELLDARTVGKAKLPSNVLGLLFHAAEHAARHTGQIVTTATIVRSLRDAKA